MQTHKTIARMTREAGTALAVLALYVLVLLAPLHQAAGLQRDLGKLGYEPVMSWSVCAPLGDTSPGDKDVPTAIKCPATGTGKSPSLAILPTASALAAPSASMLVAHADLSAPDMAILPDHVGQSRAPPGTV